jgi:hypothetical protein
MLAHIFGTNIFRQKAAINANLKNAANGKSSALIGNHVFKVNLSIREAPLGRLTKEMQRHAGPFLDICCCGQVLNTRFPMIWNLLAGKETKCQGFPSVRSSTVRPSIRPPVCPSVRPIRASVRPWACPGLKGPTGSVKTGKIILP